MSLSGGSQHHLSGKSKLLLSSGSLASPSIFSKAFIYKHFPHLCLSALEKYFRVEVEGIENIPRQGSGILLPNHSGYLGVDALILQHWIYKNKKRIPRILLHKFWYKGNVLNLHANRFGFVKASYRAGLRTLLRKRLMIIFPEGERGNFKPINEKYSLQTFRTGFARMALETDAPLIPIIIIGAEESHINIGQLSIMGQLLPLPLNTFQLPAKWKIRILKPIPLKELCGEETNGQVNCDEIAKNLRLLMQETLKLELADRKYIYFPSDPTGRKA